MIRVRGWVAALWTFAVVSLAGASAALAGPHGGGGFKPPEDAILLWGRRSGIVLMVVSALATLYVLVVRRHRLMESQSKWLLFLGLCVLPVPVAFLSSGVGMEESKKVEFCASCHAPMGPFVEDMRRPESDTLSAVHYKNFYIQGDHCWTCHSDYGVAGTTKAKLTGLMHISKDTLGKWQPPIKLYGKYNWAICLGCHANSALFRAPRQDKTAHDGVLAKVLAGETACTDCHSAAHPPREKRASR